MDSLSLIKKALEESSKIKKDLIAQAPIINKIAEEMISVIKKGGKILILGNGGSAADSQHMAAELVGRFKKEKRPLAAISLTTNTSILTAIGNDYGYEYTFSKQIEALGKKGDIVFAISTSGNAKNVIEAGLLAKKMGLKQICDEKNLLLIIDEVQTGIGRTGRMFGYQNYGITPDIMTLAKALGGGLPIGVMIAKKELSDLLTPGMHASTFGGGPVICRAALGVLKAMQKEKILKNCQSMGAYLLEKLNSLKTAYPVIKEIRGMGLMLGIELSIEGKQIVQKCLEQGLLINCTHDKVLRLMPALNITKNEIDKAVKILDSVLKECA